MPSAVLSQAPRTFRPHRAFGAVMAGAALLWVVILCYLLQFPQVPTVTLLSAAFFVALFVASGVYYGRTAIVLDRGGLTYRGILRTRRVSYADISNIDVLPGVVTIYAIHTGARLMHFSSFFKHHRELVELVVERAQLAPEGR